MLFRCLSPITLILLRHYDIADAAAAITAAYADFHYHYWILMPRLIAAAIYTPAAIFHTLLPLTMPPPPAAYLLSFRFFAMMPPHDATFRRYY